MEWKDGCDPTENIYNILEAIRKEIRTLTEILNKLIEKGITTKSDDPFRG